MRLREIRFNSFKRFTDARFVNLPADARLIVLAGPNGSGKSSFFDGLKTWHWNNGGKNPAWDETYGAKAGEPAIGWTSHATVEFHEPVPSGPEERKKLVYIRTAFRNEADFNIGSFNRLASPLDSPRVHRTIDNDASVSDNYQRMIMATIDGVYSSDLPESMTRRELRDRVIGRVQEAMQDVFPDLVLEGVGGLFLNNAQGTFYFSKGSSRQFLYKNLSAGEKAAFDLILDAVVKAEYYDNSIWCIDEPETHLNTRVQGELLDVLLRLLPPRSQMVLASHSIGFMRKAWEMAQSNPSPIAFLDFQDLDFDVPQIVLPTQPTRDFWARTLDVALGDLAGLMAPEQVVLCEGRPPASDADQKAEFDASCYRIIFASEFPGTDFLSVGNSDTVANDRLGAGRAIQTIITGTKVVRVTDRDTLSPNEVQLRIASGVRVLSRRNLESFLLDEEVLSALCRDQGQPEKASTAHQIRATEMQTSISQGHDSDDWKKPAARIYTALRRELALTQAGSDWNAFARDTLSPLVKPGMNVYEELKRDIFGS